MENIKYRVTDYSALHSVVLPSFDEAVEQADKYACVGGLPATITYADKRPGRWVVWMGAKPQFEEV